MPDNAARLVLVTPVLAEGTAFDDALAAALDAGDIACVLLRQACRDERAAKGLVRGLGARIQRHGAALLVENDPRLAAHAEADGVHVTAFGPDLEAAVERMKPARIVGCGGLGSRDDAMTAGELDVDYLMFGEPAPDGTLPAPAWTRERVGWWAEIFNVPCVGYAQSLGEVKPLALAGAEFVALGEAAFADPRGPKAAVAEALAELAAAAAETIGA